MRAWKRFVGSTVGLGLFTAVALVAAPTRTGAAPAPCLPPVATVAPTIDVAASGFVPVTPVRIVDTRSGQGAPLGPIGAGCVLTVALATAGVPTDATGVALTLTSDGATEPGYVTAYPCGSGRSETSVLNPRPNDPTPNLAVVNVDATRTICFYSDKPTELIVDVTGWFTPTGDPLHEITPTRVLDTRAEATDDSTLPVGKIGGRAVAIRVGGRAVPTGATAVAVTVTVTGTTEATYATAFPCGTGVPPTSTTNALAGRDRGAPALVGLASDGNLCVYVDKPAHLVVDVTGWFGPDTAVPGTVGSPLEQLTTTRLADSRTGLAWPAQPFGSAKSAQLDLLASVPVGTTAVQLNLIATRAAAAGFLTVYPCGQGRPEASAVNFAAGATETAMVTVGLDDSGKVCVYASARTDVVVDLFAVYGSPGGLHALTARPNPMEQGVQAGQLDHTVRCPSGAATSLTVDPAPGVLASVDGDPATAGARTVTRQVAVDGTISIQLSGAVTESHLVRCLPADFPRLTATGRATTPGWYAASTLRAPFVFLLDEYGVPVWYKRTVSPVIGAWPLANGNLAWRVWTGGGFPGGAGVPENPPLGYEIHDLSGARVGTVGPVNGTEPLDWHELLERPGGGHVVITYPQRTIGSSRPCNKSTGGTTSTNVVVDSDLVELDANGAVVWRWSSKDHTDLVTETQLPICFQVATAPDVWALDYMHLNSAERLPDGDYVVSARHFNSVSRIDRTTGAIEWKLGGTAPTTGFALTLLDSAGNPASSGIRPIGPHDARVTASGTVTLHDNHIAFAPRASEFRLDLVARTATLVDQRISANAQGGTLGSVRRQPDGSTVIGWGEGTTPWLEDVSPAGVTTLSVGLPAQELVYRVVKVPASTYDRAALRAASGGTAG